MSVISALYLDTSALVKLLVQEEHSEGLTAFLIDAGTLSSSEITHVELIRAVLRYREAALQEARKLLDQLELVAMNPALLERAGALRPLTLRSLDAIHLASAMQLGNQLRAVVTYDLRMQDAARSLGLAVAAPA